MLMPLPGLAGLRILRTEDVGLSSSLCKLNHLDTLSALLTRNNFSTDTTRNILSWLSGPPDDF